MPGMSQQVLLVLPQSEWPDWLDWGVGYTEGILKIGLNVTIKKLKGTFYGEWQQKNKEWVPQGRGAFDTEEKWILGFFKDGDWAEGSP